MGSALANAWMLLGNPMVKSKASTPRSGALRSQRAAESGVGIARRNRTSGAKDNDEERILRRLVRELEHLAASMDAFDQEVEAAGERIMGEVGQRITGGGAVALIIKAENIAGALMSFAASLRRNELRRRLPPEALGD